MKRRSFLKACAAVSLVGVPLPPKAEKPVVIGMDAAIPGTDRSSIVSMSDIWPHYGQGIAARYLDDQKQMTALMRDVVDVIYHIEPENSPFLNMSIVPKRYFGAGMQEKHEWVQDVLRPA